jgi:type II secretory pathway predicted ATPase ExeA
MSRKQAGIVLRAKDRAHDGRGVMAIMREVGVSKTTVWRLVQGRSKPPGKKPIADDIKLKIIEKAVKERKRPLGPTFSAGR